MKSIHFHPIFSEPVIEEEKWLTVRWQHSNSYEVGEVVELRSSTGIPLAEAVILSTNTVTLEEFAGEEMQGHASYGSWGQMYGALTTYYPEMPRRADEEVLVIAWKVTKILCRLKFSWGEIRFA